MFTATANLMLPSTVTGSWPRPRWFDVSMWGKPLDTCMQDVRGQMRIGRDSDHLADTQQGEGQ